MFSRRPGGGTTKTVTELAAEIASNRDLLDRIINFLGDEDIHRNFDFLPHLNAIQDYLDALFLEWIGPRAEAAKRENPDFEVRKWELASQMVKKHKQWMAKDETVKPVDWDVVKLLIETRTHVLKSDEIRQPTGQLIIPAPVSPDNPALPKEVPLHLALPPDDPNRKKLNDPLEYTKKAAQHRRVKEYAASHVEKEAASNFPTKPNFHGPRTQDVSQRQLRKALNDRRGKLMELHDEINQAYRTNNRYLVAKVLVRIAQGRERTTFESNLVADDRIEDWTQWVTSREAVSPLTDQEYKLLSILAEPSWTEHRWNQAKEAITKEKHPEDRFHIIGLRESGLETLVRYNGEGEFGHQLTMDSWAVFQRLGYRLGVEIAKINSQVEGAIIEDRGERAQRETFEDLLENQFEDLQLGKIIKSALRPGEKTDTWTPAEKAGILRREIIKESSKADTDRKLDHEKLWQFADSKKGPKRKFFSMSRWPVEIWPEEAKKRLQLTAPIREQAHVPIKLTPEEMAALEKASVAHYFAPEPRERFVKGVPYYPFGETKIQEIVLSNRMRADLLGVPGYDFTPNEGRGFWSKLNPLNWMRKRKAEDDGNDASGTRRRLNDDVVSDDSSDDDGGNVSGSTPRGPGYFPRTPSPGESQQEPPQQQQPRRPRRPKRRAGQPDSDSNFMMSGAL